MRRVIAACFALAVVGALATPAFAQADSELARVIGYFRDQYGDASVQPDVPKPPVRTVDQLPPLNPMGGDVGLPPVATDPFALDSVVEARFNFGGPGFPDSSGGPADSLLSITFDEVGNPVLVPVSLPDDGFWVPPSGPIGGDSLGGRLGLDLDDPGLQTFGGDDVIVVRDPDFTGDLSFVGTVIVRGGRVAGPAFALDAGCGGNIIEIGTADRLEGEPAWPAEFAPNDIFKDTGRAHVTRCQPGSGWSMLRLDNGGDFFQPATTRSFTLLSQQWWMTFHRPDELEGSEGHRTFVFLTPESGAYQPDSLAFYADPAFPDLANSPAPLIALDPFPGEALGAPLHIQVDLQGTWETPTDGTSGCDYYAKEYTTLLGIYPALDVQPEIVPLRLYDVVSGQIGEGTVTSNGELHLEAAGSGEGYTESWQMKGSAVDYLHSDEHGDCLYAGTVVGDGFDSFFDVFFEVPVTTTQGTEAPQSTITATTDSTLPGGGNLEGGSYREWNPIFLILGGLVIAVGGFWVYHRTRERGGSTPPPPTSHDDDDHAGNCDWAVYFNGVKLRPASGHECCVYHLSVKTVNPVFEMASKGRQDGTNPHGEDASADERLRIFDYDMVSQAPDMKGYAGTRTGPAGRQDWMHGLGDPVFEAGWKSTDAGSQLLQEKPLEEPVDVGVSLRYELVTTVGARLTSDCEDHDNWYTLDASSGISMFATQECTNGRPGPECPVELTASGIVDASVKGDVAYPLVMKAGTYPDELERKSPDTLPGPIGGIDAHDHATRPRSTWEKTDSTAGADQVNKDDTQVVLHSKLHLDSGQIVPIETWDTTERVTTDIRAELDHTLQVVGRMTPICDSGCGGHGRCDCAPEFTLRIAGGKGTITIDGATFDIERAFLAEEWDVS